MLVVCWGGGGGLLIWPFKAEAVMKCHFFFGGDLALNSKRNTTSVVTWLAMEHVPLGFLRASTIYIMIEYMKII